MTPRPLAHPLPAAAAAAVLLASCGGSGGRHSVKVQRPLPKDYVPVAVGTGAAYRPPPRTAAVRAGRPVDGMRCTAARGPRVGAHLEIFARDRVVAIPTGVGLRPPLTVVASRVTRARCAYPLITTDPSGLISLRPGDRLTLGGFFRLWGQPLTTHGAAGFSAAPGRRLVAYVGTRRWTGDPAAIPLRRHTRVVLELRSAIPPHTTYAFPPGL